MIHVLVPLLFVANAFAIDFSELKKGQVVELTKRTHAIDLTTPKTLFGLKVGRKDGTWKETEESGMHGWFDSFLGIPLRRHLHLDAGVRGTLIKDARSFMYGSEFHGPCVGVCLVLDIGGRHYALRNARGAGVHSPFGQWDRVQEYADEARDIPFLKIITDCVGELETTSR